MPTIEIDDRTVRTRVNRQQHQERLAVVEDMRVGNGLPSALIVSRCAREWKCSRRQVQKYITAVDRVYQASAAKDPVIDHARMRAVILSDHSKAITVGEYGAAAQLLRLLCHLNGWLRDRVEISATVAHVHLEGQLENYSTDELRALREFQEARARRLAQPVEAPMLVAVTEKNGVRK